MTREGEEKGGEGIIGSAAEAEGGEGKGRTYDTTTTALTLLRASSIER